MAAHECRRLLAWALPRLGLRPAGYSKVHRQVCKRLDRRRQDLGLGSVSDYRAVLETDPAEWPILDSLCRITISRFYRNARVWDALRARLPSLSSDGGASCWSAGCASGEEAWTLRLIREFDSARPALAVLGTDADPHMVDRARAARFPPGSLRELPRGFRAAFHRSADGVRLEDRFRDHVEFEVHDVRQAPPRTEPFDVVLCRNLAFTYFGPAAQEAAVDHLVGALRPGGLLVVGRSEVVDDPRLQSLGEGPGLYLRR